MRQHVKSYERVKKFGEVNIESDQIHDMLDLVDFETKRLDSRFLEPLLRMTSGDIVRK